MKAGIWTSLALLLLVALMGTEARRVYRVEIENQADLDRFLGFTEHNLLDVWSTPGLGPVDVLIPDHLDNLFSHLPLKSSVLIEDVDLLIKEEQLRMRDNAKAEFFEEYQTLDSIYAWVKNLAASYPSLVSTFVLGQTYEGREILGLKIRANRGASKEFVFNGGIHAREWISPAATLYMANEMVTKYGSETNITRMVDGIDWTIIPVLNPDGYLFTHSRDRLWRKNRQPNSGSTCIGTDLNRNYPFKWNTGGSSNLPCADTFHGPSPLSGPETKAIADYLSANKARVAGYIDIHAYSQLLMYPWGYTTALTPDNAQFKSVGDAAAAALTKVYGTRYQVGSIANIIYVSSGSSVDYTYGELNIKWSYAYELRDTGRYGFLLPADQIIPTGIETFESLKVIALQGVLGL